MPVSKFLNHCFRLFQVTDEIKLIYTNIDKNVQHVSADTKSEIDKIKTVVEDFDLTIKMISESGEKNLKNISDLNVLINKFKI